MGRPRRIKSVKQLSEAWERYKQVCDGKTAAVSDFSAKNSEFVTSELPRPITYTIEGFCVWMGISRSKFYETYAEDKDFGDTVTRIREECEVDARTKFETGQIPTQLAGLWMSKYGYTNKVENNMTGAVPVVITGGEELEDG